MGSASGSPPAGAGAAGAEAAERRVPDTVGGSANCGGGADDGGGGPFDRAGVERLGDAGNHLPGAAFGLAGALLGVVDPPEHVLKPALALRLLVPQLGQPLGALGALLGLSGLRLDQIEAGARLLERLLGLFPLLADPAFGLVELLDQLAVALSAAVDLLVGDS